jgi:hypothetical protein
MIESGIVQTSQGFTQGPGKMATNDRFRQVSSLQKDAQIHAFRQLANQKESPSEPIFPCRQEFRAANSLLPHGAQDQGLSIRLGAPAKAGPGVGQAITPRKPVLSF